MASPVIDIEDVPAEDAQVELKRPAELETLAREILEIDLDDIVGPGGQNIGLEFLKQDQYVSKSWMLIASEHLRQGRGEMAERTLVEGLGVFQQRQDWNGMSDAYTLLAHMAISQAKGAPKVVLKDAKYDTRAETQVKQDFWRLAQERLQSAERLAAQADGNKDRSLRRLPILIGRILLLLASFHFDEAERAINQALRIQPNNLVVLMCQGRLGNATRNPQIALKSFQRILALDPDFSPDPRVGLGLAFWQSGDVQKAKLAWRRALERDPECHGARMLLATSEGNDARDLNLTLSSDKRQDLAIASLNSLVQLFNKTGKTSAPAALAMVRNVEVKGQVSMAIKLVERAIQFSDTMAHTRRGISERTRLAYVEGDMRGVSAYAERAKMDKIPDITVEVVRAQVAIQQGNQREALAIMEELYKKVGPTAPIEVTWLYAMLLAFPYPGTSSEQRFAWTRESRDILDRLHEQVKAARNAGPTAAAKLRGLAEDPETFVLLARLWQTDDLDKAIGAYQTAISIHTLQRAGEDATDNLKRWKLDNNLASLYHLQGNLESATQLYEDVVSAIAEPKSPDEEALQSTVLYNLGRAYEDAKDYHRAIEAYRGLLFRHPEYIHAKIRLSEIAYVSGRILESDSLLKEANLSQPSDLHLRGYVQHHLFRQGNWEMLAPFAQQSRVKYPDDVQTWCILGACHYRDGRESKAPHNDRLKDFCKSGEAYNQALAADPACAVAAQGLAIAIAEDAMATKPSELLGGEEMSKSARLKNADAALAIFSRVKDSLSDGSVLVNSGHCYFIKGDEERAIESYGAASIIYQHQNVQALLYLTRAHYQLGTRKSNFSAMLKALSFCQKAMRLRPADQTILYNVAMIEQKAAELLLGLPSAERTLAELEQAIGLAEHSIVLFRTLADVRRDRSLSYDPDLADQRSKYGESLLRKAGDQRQQQEAYESSQTEKDTAAKRRRAEERSRIEELERVKIREAQQRAEEEAEILREQKEQARAWAQQTRLAEEEEEIRKSEIQRSRRERKEQEATYSGGEGGGERKSKRKSKKKKKEDSPVEEGMAVDEDEAEATDEEPAMRSPSNDVIPRIKPKKKRPAVIDPDGEEAEDASRPLKKTKIKSVAVLSDTDSD